MQLYALTQTGECIFSRNAFKKINYICHECGEILRLREGEIRQPHFYHFSISSKRACRQNSKSLNHLQVQLQIASRLPNEDVSLECRFDSIARIADVAWHSQKIIFEIQCSPMFKEEMQARVADYEKVGYTVVWILHDKRYNQWRLSSLEKALSQLPHYYTNINALGEGIIYDQWAQVERGIRKRTLPRLLIDVSKPYFTNHRIGFTGDIGSLPDDDPYFTQIPKFQKKAFRLTTALSWIKKAWREMSIRLLKPYCSD